MSRKKKKKKKQNLKTIQTGHSLKKQREDMKEGDFLIHGKVPKQRAHPALHDPYGVKDATSEHRRLHLPAPRAAQDGEFEAGVLHAVVRHEEKMKSQEQRRIREIRDQFENNAEQSVEMLSELNELVARQEDNPSEFLAKSKKIGVPQKLSSGKTKRVFDKGLPTIPQTYNQILTTSYGWDSVSLARAEDMDDATAGFRASRVMLATTQKHIEIGEKICSVSAGETSAAEELDGMVKLTGGDIIEALPSLAFWFKRRIQNTNTHFVIVTTLRDIEHGNSAYYYELTDHGKLKDGFANPGKGKLVGTLSIVYLDNDEEVGTLAIPMVEEESLLDSFCECYPAAIRDRIIELYNYEGEPASNKFMFRPEDIVGREVASGLTEVQMLTSLCIAKAVINCMGLMLAEPEYIRTKKVLERVHDPDSKDSRASRKKGKVRTRTIMELRARVEEDPPWSGTGITGADSGRKEHWRKTHYVRKHHSHKWRLNNPDGVEMYFPDGRPYHLCLIKSTKVSASKARKGATDGDIGHGES